MGPFANPLVISSVLLVTSLILALLARRRAARMLAAASILSTVTIAFLAPALTWSGPSLPTAAIFAGFGILAAAPLRGGRATVKPAIVLFALIVVLGVAENMVAPWFPDASGWIATLESLVFIVGILSAIRHAWRVPR